MDTSKSAAERAELLLDAMTLDQKLQQIYNEPVYNEDLDVDGDPETEDPTRLDCNFTEVGRHIEGIPELDIPDFRQANGGTGIRGGDCSPEPIATALPAQVASAATFNRDLNFQWGELLDVELRAWAHHVLWGPGMNLIRTPYGGRNHEYFSEDPYLTGVMASEIISGIQARGVSQATAKHFVANESEYQFERWTSAHRVPSRAMHELYLLPFEMAVKDADVASVMCAYPHVNFSYNCDSSPLLQQTLRDRWGFDGYVFSDRRAQQSTLASILAGVDVELDETADWYKPELVKALIDSGEITEAHIDDLLRERYIKMFEFGDFDDPHTEFLWDELDPLIAAGGEHAQLAKNAAAESLVLLRNDQGLLPLNAADVESIALIGAEWFAGEATLPPRSGNREENEGVIEPYQVTPEEGLENVLESLGSDAEVVYNDGDVIADAEAVAADADITILMVGDVARETWDKNSNWMEENPGGGTSGAGNEIPDLDLPSVTGTNQQELIPRILAANPNTVVVMKTQGQVNMPWINDVHTMVQAWYPGQEDGNVVAEALFGVTNFSGKLPITIGATDREAAYATQEQYPGNLEDTGVPGGIGRDPLCVDPDEALPCEVSGPAPQRVVRYTENLEVGYRWYEANGVEPLFPFGFGLSYTTFEYSDLELAKQVNGNNGQTVVTASFTLTNTGEVAGAEAAQVYLTLPARADEPAKRLVGFEKVALQPGESKRVSVVVDSTASNHPFSYFVPDTPDDLAKWADGDWRTAGGNYTFHVGGSSANTPLEAGIHLGFPERWAGIDRFETAAAISSNNYDPGVGVVYVANGLNFPDALAGAAVAGRDSAPMLLVQQGVIPSVIAAELDRLNPGRIVVLGGTGVVSDAVLQSLEQYTAGTVTRLAGTDRFGTAAAISSANYDPGVGVAYVANGMNFPDALAGAAVAGRDSAPMLLVQQGVIPSVIAAELDRLNPGRIVVLGGTGVVSDAVVQALDQYTPRAVQRIAGLDRFGTAAAISSTFEAGVDTVYVATGRDFPDALAGAAVAGMTEGPLLLVEVNSIPPAVAAELARLNPARIVVLGGTGVVNEGVFKALEAYVG